jgi:anion-transporting  ArsA/GET3 family ATPase
VTELPALIRERRIIVCCGSGGVGKTTTAAAIAVEAARQGRRTCVVTIDPARRLADALGLDSLTNNPGPVDGTWPGELWALMLDTRSTFDDAVTRYARDQSQAEAIIGSRLYRNLCDTLSGTQEYMAVEKLYQLHQEGGFDLIVVDTPPGGRAEDFLSAPRHLTRLLDNPVFRILAAPGRVYVRAAAVAARAPLRAASKIVGDETLLETVAFFRAFEGMNVGIRTRAQRVLDLLAEPSTAFVLVVSPRRDAIEESQSFAERLDRCCIPVQALIVNRLHPRFDVQPGATSPAAPNRRSGRARVDLAEAFPVLRSNWAELRAAAAREEMNIAALAARVAPAPVARVPLLPTDIHDLDAVESVADHLFGPSDTGHRSACCAASPRRSGAAIG